MADDERVKKALDRYDRSRTVHDAVAAATEISKTVDKSEDSDLARAVRTFWPNHDLVLPSEEAVRNARAMPVVRRYLESKLLGQYVDLLKFVSPK